MPENVNEGNLRIHFVLEVIKTMKVLRKKTLISERAWSILRKTFHEIDNL